MNIGSLLTAHFGIGWADCFEGYLVPCQFWRARWHWFVIPYESHRALRLTLSTKLVELVAERSVCLLST